MREIYEENLREIYEEKQGSEAEAEKGRLCSLWCSGTDNSTQQLIDPCLKSTFLRSANLHGQNVDWICVAIFEKLFADSFFSYVLKVPFMQTLNTTTLTKHPLNNCVENNEEKTHFLWKFKILDSRTLQMNILFPSCELTPPSPKSRRSFGLSGDCRVISDKYWV